MNKIIKTSIIERKCDEMKQLIDTFWIKIHLIDVEINLYLFLQISIQQLLKPLNWYVWLEIEISGRIWYNIPVNLQNNK